MEFEVLQIPLHNEHLICELLVFVQGLRLVKVQKEGVVLNTISFERSPSSTAWLSYWFHYQQLQFIDLVVVHLESRYQTFGPKGYKQVVRSQHINWASQYRCMRRDFANFLKINSLLGPKALKNRVKNGSKYFDYFGQK